MGVRIAERWFDRRRIDDDITKKSEIGVRVSAPGDKAVVPAIWSEQPVIAITGLPMRHLRGKPKGCNRPFSPLANLPRMVNRL